MSKDVLEQINKSGGTALLYLTLAENMAQDTFKFKNGQVLNCRGAILTALSFRDQIEIIRTRGTVDQRRLLAFGYMRLAMLTEDDKLSHVEMLYRRWYSIRDLYLKAHEAYPNAVNLVNLALTLEHGERIIIEGKLRDRVDIVALAVELAPNDVDALRTLFNMLKPEQTVIVGGDVWSRDNVWRCVAKTDSPQGSSES